MKAHWSKLVIACLMVLVLAAAQSFGCAEEEEPEGVNAQFSGSPRSGTAPLEVQFTDQSTGDINQWDWDFDGDGTVDSMEQSPSHTYETVGRFAVSLKVTGSDGSDTETKTNYIEVTEKEKVTITIGNVTDLTGAAAAALKGYTWAMTDLVAYTNETDPIPGVTIKLETYDTKYDPSRDLLGYEWVRSRGAEVIFTPLTTLAEGVKPRLEDDGVVIFSPQASAGMIEPPGWVFAAMPTFGDMVKPLFEWVSEQWDYTKGKPKIGSVGWNYPYGIDHDSGLVEYCDAHPDKFDYVGSYLSPVGTMTWMGEVQALKDCDFIFVIQFGSSGATFVNEFLGQGYEAQFLCSVTPPAYFGIMKDMCGEEALDGYLAALPCGKWGDGTPLTELAETLLYEYHPGDAEAEIAMGQGYQSAVIQFYVLLEILRDAVQTVGAENFDGQAFYNAAIEFETQFEGYPEWSLGETRRTAMGHVQIWEFSATIGDFVRISEWLPLMD